MEGGLSSYLDFTSRMERLEQTVFLLVLAKVLLELSEVENFKAGDLLANTLLNLSHFWSVIFQLNGFIAIFHGIKIGVVEEQLFIRGLRRNSTKFLSK